MLRKLRKLILHPKWYFYDYFRKKLGFRKYFVTDKIKLLDSHNHQKWLHLIISHPYLYFYYKFNKILRKPAYPILVSYRIVALEESVMGGGKGEVLAVELEGQNTIYFADEGIVKKIYEGLEPYLFDKISKINFKGVGNQVLIESKVRFGKELKINFIGNDNKLKLGVGTIIKSPSRINFIGNCNTLHTRNNVILWPTSKIIFNKDNNELFYDNCCELQSGFSLVFKQNSNYLYAGKNVVFKPSSDIIFYGSNSLAFFYINQKINGKLEMFMDNIFFSGEHNTYGDNFACSVGERKNVLIGSDCMIAWDIIIRNDDGHMIFDKKSKKHINQARSIIIGDHVWIGRKAQIMKGAHIQDGVMVGANSIVTRNIEANSLCAGVPAEIIRHDILWSRECAINYTKEKLIESSEFTGNKYKYKSIGYDKFLKIDAINPEISAIDKVKLIQDIIEN